MHNSEQFPFYVIFEVISKASIDLSPVFKCITCNRSDNRVDHLRYNNFA